MSLAQSSRNTRSPRQPGGRGLLRRCRPSCKTEDGQSDPSDHVPNDQRRNSTFGHSSKALVAEWSSDRIERVAGDARHRQQADRASR